MAELDSSNQEKLLRYFLFGVALLFDAVLTCVSLQYLRQIHAHPILSLTIFGLCGLVSLIPIFLGWLAFKRSGMSFFLIVAIAGTTLVVFLMGERWFVFFPSAFVGFAIFLYLLEEHQNAELMVRDVEIEKQVTEKNDLELTYKEKGKSISVCFEKYSAYYNLRRLADEFSSTLDLTKLGDLIVTRTLEFVLRGELCLLFLASSERDEISLIASKSTDPKKKIKEKLGDLFDFWVLRNRQHLLISDTQKDFRFDQRKLTTLELRSVILSPLIYAGRVVGTLRVDSSYPDTFSTEQLRLLDAISALASTAISNALLYQKTVELAIRDSLTGLYVQRYFLERLREEHKRALLAHTSLSLLMCDLDHFKKINDQHGHAVGDMALVRFAEVLKKVNEHGIIARYGGEEFVVLLPHTSLPESQRIAEEIRNKLEKEKIEIRRESLRVTTSIGVASLPEDTLDSEELLRLADERLYEAKRNGRNRVC